jgi:hypothetical protein
MLWKEGVESGDVWEWREIAKPEFFNFSGALESIPPGWESIPGLLVGRYDNPIPPRFLAPIDYSKIPAHKEKFRKWRSTEMEVVVAEKGLQGSSRA